MSSFHLEIQIFYEIAMSIGNELDLKTMLRSSLPTYLRKLNCSSGTIFKEILDEDNMISFEQLFSIPRNALKEPICIGALKSIGATINKNEKTEFYRKLPLTVKVMNNFYYHCFELPGFGLLLIGKHEIPLDTHIIKSLYPLNKKLAQACNVCLQNDIIQQTNEALKKEIYQRTKAEGERYQLELQVQQAQKLESLGVLAGGIAHDFNNLLMGILGNADLALLKTPPSCPGNINIEKIKKAAKRAGELCKQMLVYSGKGEFITEPLDLSEVVFEMGGLLEMSISKKVKLQYNIPPNLPHIKGDVTQIRQIILNFITNASDAYEAENGVILISMGIHSFNANTLKGVYDEDYLPAGDYVYLEVIDNGIGMDEETLVKIFDPFFSTKLSGRGLGLATVLGIIRGHKGALHVKSEIGQGSTFTVYFPVSSDRIHTQMPIHSASHWKGKGLILLVDDDDMVRASVSEMLHIIGFEVMPAPDGFTAIETFKQYYLQISLVLLDMKMPEMNGEETFYKIRKIKNNIPIILSSGYDEKGVKSHLVNKNFSSFIHKPYELDTLRSTIYNALHES